MMPGRNKGWLWALVWCVFVSLSVSWVSVGCIPSLPFLEGEAAESNGEAVKSDEETPASDGAVAEEAAAEVTPEPPAEDVTTCRPAKCITPPASTCKNGSTLITYESPGSCDATTDKCVYKAIDKSCPEVCKGDVCTSKCAGKTCTTPPAPKCDKGKLLTYAKTGTCKDGTCEYSSTPSSCPYGCNNGKCLPRPACLDVDCKTPPKPTCANSSTLRTYKAGSCKGDKCSYGYSDKACPVGCASGKCRPVTGFTPLRPHLLLDSRKSGGKLGAGAVKCWNVVATKKVPSDAKAVFVTVTSVQSTATGYISIYPKGTSATATAALSYITGDAIANGVIVQVGSQDQICLFTEQSTHVIVFLRGYFGATTDYRPIKSTRVFDTRKTSGKPAAQSATCSGDLGSKGVASTAKAAFFTVSAVQTEAPGFLTAYRHPSRPAELSQVNYLAGENTAGGAIVPPGSGRQICVYTQGKAHMTLDVTGYFGASSTYTPLAPSRPVNRRSGAKPGGGTSTCHTLNPKGTVVPSNARAVALHVTAVHPDSDGYLQVYYPGSARVEAASVNFKKGKFRSAFTIVQPDKSARVCVYVSHPTYYIVDLVGFWR